MPATALFRGPAHVMEYADDEVIAAGQRDGRGVPVREMFPEPEWAKVQAAMDRVFRSGSCIRMAHRGGTILLCPRVDSRGRVFGVASYYRADLVIPVAPLLPILRELPLPLSRAG